MICLPLFQALLSHTSTRSHLVFCKRHPRVSARQKYRTPAVAIRLLHKTAHPHCLTRAQNTTSSELRSHPLCARAACSTHHFELRRASFGCDRAQELPTSCLELGTPHDTTRATWHPLPRNFVPADTLLDLTSTSPHSFLTYSVHHLVMSKQIHDGNAGRSCCGAVATAEATGTLKTLSPLPLHRIRRRGLT